MSITLTHRDVHFPDAVKLLPHVTTFHKDKVVRVALVSHQGDLVPAVFMRRQKGFNCLAWELPSAVFSFEREKKDASAISLSIYPSAIRFFQFCQVFVENNCMLSHRLCRGFGIARQNGFNDVTM